MGYGEQNGLEIAIIGLAGRFPGAKNIEEFWHNLRAGVETISLFSTEELLSAGVDQTELEDPSYVRRGGVIEDIDLFDAAFFGYSPREAELLDPQQRLFLECAEEALENAGYDARHCNTAIGVYAGTGLNTYFLRNLYPWQDWSNINEIYQAVTTNDKDFLASRVAYKLNLRGPALVIQTACSTSLVAVHMAVQGLLSGECSMALAGGVTIRVPHKAGYRYQEGNILAPDGHCRAFDAEAQGTVASNGVGVVVLKRLEDALTERDHIYAVIKGSAINNDGAAKVGYTAPGVRGQAQVIRAAQLVAGVNAERIGYIETHGTGTALGDPIEIAALTEVFRAQTEKKRFCALGSVKTNIGHTDAAAGIAGLIKTIYSLQEHVLLPSLHFQTPNPALHLEKSPFYVNDTLRAWQTDGQARCAGVSSFGIGGTNAHVILEERPEPEDPPRMLRPYQLLVLSARTERALGQASSKLAAHLRQHPDIELADVAYTLQTGRPLFQHRQALVCRNTQDAALALETGDASQVMSAVKEGTEEPVALLFPGQGAQYVDMGRDLYRSEPVFRAELDHCAELLTPCLGNDLRETLYPEVAEKRAEATECLKQTRVTQPALFALEYALARQWLAWGIRPVAMIGHSIGEYVAACLAGVFSLEDALRLVAARGCLMQQLPAGAMLALALPEQEVQTLLTGQLCLATVNTHTQCVVSGPTAEIEELARKLQARGIDCQHLHTSHAFHSAMVEPILSEFTKLVESTHLSPPQIPYISNLTGTWITHEQATDPLYWSQHMRQPVQFANGISEILREPAMVLLEVGPGRTLSTFARAQDRLLATQRAHTIVSSLKRPVESRRDDEFLLTSLGRLWLAGVPIAWDKLHADEKLRRLPLPTYPFERNRYWIDPPQGKHNHQQAQLPFSLNEERQAASEEQKNATLYARPELSTRYVAPRNQLEEKLATLWEQLLGVARIGVYDSFFELGGHSLLATQLVSRLRSDLQIHLPLRAIFEATTIAELSNRLEEHADAQTGEEALSQPILPIERSGTLPLSYSQQRLWFLWQMEPGAGFFNIPQGLRLQGPLNLEVLEQSLQELIKRQEILRTTFILQENELKPVIAPGLSITIEHSNLQAVPASEQEHTLQRLATTQVQQAFDLEHGPLWRVTLFRLDRDKAVLLITMHHMISDGWSFGIFIHELMQIYQAFQAGHSLPLEPLAIQYVDFAAWQKEWLQGAEIARQRAYWQQQLSGPLPILELPTDHPRPAIQSYHGTHLPFQLPDDLTERLNSFSQQEHVTMFMLLLAAFQVVCFRYSGQEDILIGTPIANRRRTEIEKLIGCFINTLVIRAHLVGELSFRALLQEVREKTLEAYAHQDLPFEQLVEALQPERDLSRSPIFQVMFMLQNVPLPATEIADLRLSTLDTDNGATQFDLTLVVNETDQHLTGFVEYNVDLFEAETVKRLIEHWQSILSAAARDCTCRIADLPLMTEAEQRSLNAWNATQRDWSEPACIPQLFSKQVERSPDALALIQGNCTWTYDELNQAANRVAHALHARGIGPGHLVGICLERSAELVVALLGVHKAGAAYIPLDPAYPQERLTFMLTDSCATALLTQATLAERFSLIDSLAVISLPLPDHTTHWEQDLEQAIPGEAIAYVIYTSGSTGKPKGVMISQKALRNCLLSMAAEPGMTATDRILAVTSFSFDIAALELLLPLMVGASIVIASQDEVIDAQALLYLLDATQVTFMQATPATWQMLLHAGWQPQRPLTVLCGGEALPQALAQQLCLRSQNVWNMYGPTETTIWSTTCPISESEASISIGHPIANTQLYILDARGGEVPLGVAGELFIGGDGLAHGYWQRPALTAERFVPDPFSPTPGARLYRTGDLVRRCSDGRLIYLNRLDFQVKIRGHRIELGEIEAKLAQHPTVRDCILAVSEKGDYHTRLIAFLILEPSTLLDSNELRRHLAQQLPDYMIPSHFQAVERWPLTPNGKIDKKALLLLDLSVSQATASSVPDNAIEEILAEVWARILHRDAPGTDENFFDLGGHSLLATQLLGQVRTLFALDIPLRSLFEYPTIKAFARLIEQRLRHGQEQLRPPLLPVPSEQSLLPSYAQQRLWFLEQLEPGTAAYHIPIALRIRGPLDARALEQSLDGIIQRHETLRTAFATHAGQIKLSVIAPLNTTFELSLREVGEQNLQALIHTELLKPFDFSSPPLLRATLFHLEQENYVLLVILHHIASDGPSCTLLVYELMQHYLAFVRGETSTLPALPIQYSDFACWQRQWLSGAMLDAQLDYWKRQLADIAPLELPTDYPRPAIQTFRGADTTFTLSHELTAALRALSKQEGVTLFMTLLTAFQILLYSYTGQEDITVGTPITNRNQEELDRLIGLFINTLALRVNLAHNPTFAELLAKVRETCLEAYAHQHLPFEQIVDTLQPERDLSRSPLFQVMFVFQHAATIDMQAELDPLQISLFELNSRASKYDLTLEITANNQNLCGRVEYATDLFDASSIERLITHWQMILAWCVDNASERIAACPLLAPDEYQRCIEQWNATRRDYVARECLHQLIEEQVAHNPHRPAVIFEKEQLSYRELNQRANQLAHYLQSAGIGPDVLVGVCLERSLELVISLLAILKAGGAYVPFDPSYPAQRLAFMLEDSGVPVLLTDAHLRPHLPACQARIICLDQLSTQLASLSEENPDPPVHAENLAYMIYTSGSTGTPKGAMNTHRAICNRLLWMQDAYHLTEADRVLQKTPFSFDVSVWEFFLPLLAGACLVVARPDGHRDPEYLVQLIRERHITTLHFVPSMLQNFLEAPGLEYCQSLRRVICSGEALSIETQKRFFSRISAELHNLYGPTEAAVDVTAWRCESESSRQSVPIGYPIANIQIYLLNKHLQPVPIGASGELHIGGMGLARGYWQRAGLTAERFIPDPFSQLPGARLYKTGDLARFLPDGAIEFQGRIDHQVKVRGFRIELGEIEAALTQHQEIRECAVVVREDTPGVKRLIAYMIPRQTESIPSPIALRDYLQQRLPDYMIPALFVPIEQLPLSPSGKLDRRALPPPTPIQPEDNATFTPPGTQIEQALASIWAEVLGLERVSITDNFFALGGDSILSMQIIARAARANIRLTPKQIFRQQTIEALARVADAPTPLQAEQGIVEGPAPLTPIQHWFFEQKLEDRHHWNQSALLQLAGAIDAYLLEKAFETLFTHHDALRLRFTQCEARWQQVNVGNEPVPPFFEQCNLAGQTNEGQRHMIEETQACVQASLDLTHGPLLRVVFFDRGQEQPGLLLICIHHLIVDNVSWQILLDDLQIAYQALQQHVQPHFPPKTTSYQHWAEELVRYAQSEKPRQELDFWLEQNRGEVTPLPTDHNGCNTIASTRMYTLSLSREETNKLQEIATHVYQIPLSDIVLAMLALTFVRWTRTDAVLIDAEGHGREEISEEIEVSRTVGWFTSIYPLYLQLQHTDSESAALGKTRDRLCSLPQKGFNYGVLRYLLADLTLLKRFHELPSAEILFNYIGQLDQLISSAPLFKEIVPSSAFDRSPAGTRKHLFEIISGISNGQLYVDWRYSNQKHDPSTVERLAADFIQSLRNLLQQSRAEEARALLSSHHSRSALTTATPATIPLTSRNQPLPLSFAQQRLWFLDQLLLENSLYNITRALRIQGPLQVAALKQSIAEIVRRHEALRTTFPEANGEAIQKIHPGEMAWSEIDLQHLAREERQMQAFALLQDEVQIPMDLANGPLIRLLLLKLSPEEHILGVTVHHIIFDVWSEGIFLRELLALYKAFSAGQPSPLAELPIQYADFAVWQRQRLQGRVLEEHMAYWRQHLHNASILELPTDHARKPFQSYKGAMLPFSFDKKLSSALAHLSQREGVTLFMTLLTGFMGLLRRYSGQTDIVVGTDIANRTSIETEQLIGFFVNLLILRGDLSGNPQFSHVLQQISNLVLNAYAHQDLPFEKLIEGLHLERDGNHIPLARVLFVFQNTPWVELNAEGLTLTSIVIEQDVTRFELAFFLWETPEGLKGTVNYSTDLFEATTIARIIMHFQTFLQHICTQPDIRLDSIKIHDEVDETNRRVSQLRKLKKAQRANK